MYFIGLDLAWAAKNRTGIAVLDERGALQHISSAISDDEIIDTLKPYVGGDCLVALDAPLRVTNHAQPRPAERLLNVDFRKYQAEARPAFKSYPNRLFDPPRGEVLAEKLQLTIDPDSADSRRAIEVYPHPATVVLFKLHRTLKYKRGKGTTPKERTNYRKSEMIKLADHIETLATALLPMTVTNHADWSTLRTDLRLATRPVELDRLEDPIDAVLCAYLAMMFVRHRQDMTIYGDYPNNGYIATPALPADFQPVPSAADDEYGPSAVSLIDLAVEARRCHSTARTLQTNWETVEAFLHAEDATEKLTNELVQSLRRAANAARHADQRLHELLQQLEHQ